MIVRTQVEKAARAFVEDSVERYGVVSALSRARMLVHDRRYRHSKPQWLRRAIEILERMEKDNFRDRAQS
jgi:hypothetical protein